MSELTDSAVETHPGIEARVILAAQAGDEDAWELLYRHVYPRLRTYLVRRVGPELVEDAVSDTMSRAIRGIGRFEPKKASFDAWVFGIAGHVAVDIHRHQVRVERHRRSIETHEREDERQPEEVTILAEEHELVRSAFDRLSQNERDILELRIVAQLSAEETAAALGKKPGAVRTAQSRALAHLRQLLEEHGA